MTRRINITGMRSGKLTAIKDTGISSGDNGRRWLCKCECGGTTTARATDIISGYTKSCGCLSGKNSKPKGEASFNRFYAQYGIAAKRRNIKFTLTKTQFKKITSQKCYYCEHPPTTIWKVNKRLNGLYPHNGVDRIDNSKGYVKNNCVPCCSFCNNAKSAHTQKEFLGYIEKIYKNCFKKQRI